MKPIILDINEITDSRELLESKPSPAIPVFIYLMISLIAIALTWSYFGELDEYVKANGIVRPNDKVGAIRNMVSGKVEKVFFEEGQQVKKDDVLYIIEHENLDIEEATLQEELDRYSFELENLIKLRQSITDGKSYFDKNNEDEKLFYDRYQKYLMDIKVDSNSAYTELERSENNTELNLLSIEEKKANLSAELEKLELLKQSITIMENLFTDNNNPYFSKYVDYSLNLRKYQDVITERKSKYETISHLMEIEKSQKNSSEKSTSISEASGDKTIEALNNLYLLKQSISSGKNLFKDISNPYYNQYIDYTLNIKRLEENINQKKQAYERAERLFKVGSIAKKELENSEVLLNSAKAELEKYKNDYWLSINEKIDQAAKSSKDLENAKLLIDSAELDMEKYKNDYTYQLNQQIFENNKQLNELELSIISNSKDIELYKDIKSNISNSVKKYKIDNLVQLNDAITAIEKNIEKLEKNLKSIKLNINNCTVTAQIDGIVSVFQEITKGDLLQSGAEVGTIIPSDNTEYKIQLYVSNKDIANIVLGQKIKYHFLALPYREYGEITGYVTKIGTDARMEKEKGISYYPVEATVENKPVYSYKGVKAEIKVGMACEAQVITKSKKIIYWLLEKINLKD